MKARTPGTYVSNGTCSPQAACNTSQSARLSLVNCRFPGNALQKNWLSTNLSIEELNLHSCSLSKIEDDAFADPIFKAMTSLSLLDNDLVSLGRASFQPLSRLKSLIVQDDIVERADRDLLEHVAGTLGTLDLSGAIADQLVLRNITGAGSLGRLLSLSLQRNTIAQITDETFLGVPKVQALYLMDSSIRSLSRDSLKPMSSSIEKLIITGNQITSLPQGLLDGVLSSHRPFFMALKGNLWNCDCGLKWMQDAIKNHSDVATDGPACASPSENVGKTFDTAVFCRQDSGVTGTEQTSTSSSTGQTAAEVSTEAEMIGVNCSTPQFLASASQRKLLSSDLKIQSRLQGFAVNSVTDESIMLKLPSRQQRLTLLWFESGDPARTVKCARYVSHIYQVQDIDPQTTYTICLLNDNGDTVTPLNCLAATTLPSYESRAWLRNRDQPGSLLLLALTVIMVFALGILATYLSIRKHPSLLRGSKRVMLVKKNIVDAIVLPRGVNVEEQRGGSLKRGNAKSEDGYITPLPPTPVPPPRDYRISRVSLQSDWNSYMSEMEPSESQLVSWRMAEIGIELETPPLPPHPSSRIPSVSLTVGNREDDPGQEE
ncbi:uncharacterized protein LOC117225771 [Megalopta genalis]|uniref:uncharacterized protein LOC117225771 n=1 Tax=Megalopta genalis TaxID=115081 RepID=UPI003FD29B75